jgi:putative holliday junction resolvase
MARLLGIDPGTKRCGVAITDSAETMAFPRESLIYGDSFVADVGRLADEEGAELIVIGRPVALGGAATASTTFADELFARLSEGLEVPVIQHDERLTTTAAHRSLHAAGLKLKEHRGRVDSAAAVVMLQHFADVRRAR